MAKMIRLVADVAREKLADAMEALTAMGASVAVLGADAVTDADDDDTPVQRSNGKHTPRTASAPLSMAGTTKRHAAPNGNTFRGRAVVYTPAGTQRQIDAAMAKLRPGSLSAYVFKDLAKHPGSANADVRKRLSKIAEKIGASVESVDNIIWNQVNKGLLKKSAASTDL